MYPLRILKKTDFYYPSVLLSCVEVVFISAKQEFHICFLPINMTQDNVKIITIPEATGLSPFQRKQT